VACQVYCQPIYEACDKTFGNILAPVWCMKNTVVRLVCRTIFICLACLVSTPLCSKECMPRSASFFWQWLPSLQTSAAGMLPASCHGQGMTL
jgi:hypothetical protein